MDIGTRKGISMKARRNLQLLYGAAALLFLGLIYGWSIFVKPLEEMFAWNRAQTSLVFTFSMSFFCVGGFVSGMLLRKKSSRFVLRLSSACMLSGLLLASRVTSLWGLYLSYGVLCGLGVGLGYNAILSTVGRWFPDKPGFCSGMLLLGFGLGALLLGTGASLLIGAFGWRTTFLVFAALFSVALFACASLVRAPSETELSALPKSAAHAAESMKAETPPNKMLRTLSFWALFLWCMVGSAIGLAMVGQAVPLALEAQAVSLTAVAAGLVSASNGLSRLLFGAAFDRFGRLKTMLFNFLMVTLCIGLLYAALLLKSTVLLVIGLIVLGAGYGGLPAIAASATRELFGSRNYAINYSIVTLHAIFGALIGPIIAGNIYASNGTYLPMFPILALLLLPMLVFALLLPKARTQ